MKKFIKFTQPLIQKIARAYGIRVDNPTYSTGPHPLTIMDFEFQLSHNIPNTVSFNTMCGSITVGENTVFGHDVKVLTGKHCNIEEAAEINKPLHYVPENGRDITIGRGCYIGTGAIIIGPVNIGDYTMIGAGAVVTKDLPSYSFAVGVPAKVIKKFVTKPSSD